MKFDLVVKQVNKELFKCESPELDARYITAKQMQEVFDAEHILNEIFPNFRFHISSNR